MSFATTEGSRVVLVIGAAGLVGSHLLRAFDHEKTVGTYHRTPVTNGIELDITDHAAAAATLRRVRPDVIVLAAAEPWVDRCEREPEVTRRVNVHAAANLITIARNLKAMLVVFSSEYVFDGSAGPYGEDDQIRPLNEYGRQKAELEQLARTLDRHLVCRTSGVFGHERAEKNFVCQLVTHARVGRRFRVPTDQVITPTYAPDLAGAVVALIRANTSGTFHVVGPKILRRMDFAAVIARVYGLPLDLIEGRATADMGYLAARPRNAGLKGHKIRSLLGAVLRSPEAALRDMRLKEPPRAPH